MRTTASREGRRASCERATTPQIPHMCCPPPGPRAGADFVEHPAHRDGQRNRYRLPRHYSSETKTPEGCRGFETSSAAGRSRITSVPEPEVETTSTRPPCSAIDLR